MPDLKPGARTRSGKVADGAAIGASFLCIIHCLLLPVAIAFLPAAGNLAGIPEGFHLALVVFAIPVSAYAIVAGHRLHGAWLPAAVAIFGFALIVYGAVAGVDLLVEVSVTSIGSTLVAVGHLFNWRARAVSLVAPKASPQSP